MVGIKEPPGDGGVAFEYAAVTVPSTIRITVSERSRSRAYTSVSTTWPFSELTAHAEGMPYAFVTASAPAPNGILSAAGKGGRDDGKGATLVKRGGGVVETG